MSLPALEEPEPAPLPPGYEIELEDLAVPSPPPAPEFAGELVVREPASNPASETVARAQNQPSAVLGRISLVRKGADARRLELLAKLLAFY
jgi:hypothetical protein